MTLNGRFAQLTLFERGCCVAVQVRRLDRLMMNLPVHRFDIVLLNFIQWKPTFIDEGCGCTGWAWLVFGFQYGYH